ncbi:MAG: hypothetical protein NTX61_01860 [Bacteroidetes bacterium]|nr:hypothetical protein [Bacteroidota bacterium]
MKKILNIIYPKHVSFFLIIWSILTFLPCNLYSQNDSKNSSEQDFQYFKKRIEKDFSGFKNHNDSAFTKFLEETWKEFTLFKEDICIRKKPKEQPIAPKTRENIELPRPDTVINFKEIKLPPEQPEENPPPKNNHGKLPNETMFFNFFGQKLEIPEIINIPSLDGIDSKNILAFYQDYLKNEKLLNMVTSLNLVSIDFRLNDCGYFFLIRNAAERIFPNNINERVLFTWITLIRNGLNAKVGYDKENIYLLIDFDGKVYNLKYINFIGIRYYLLPFLNQNPPQQSLQSYNAKYPGQAKPVSIVLNDLPRLKCKLGNRKFDFNNDTIPVPLNIALIDFLNDYPCCELQVYFNAPVSEDVLKSLDKHIKPFLNGKTEVEKVDILLRFLQNSFPYKTDQEQFGREKYFFGDESFYYPYTDCDDRAILLSHLVKRYTNLETIGLDYPDHVSLGVKFQTSISGDYITFNGYKYFICDPTYIGAHSGMAMECMKNKSPKIILIRNQ